MQPSSQPNTTASLVSTTKQLAASTAANPTLPAAQSTSSAKRGAPQRDESQHATKRRRSAPSNMQAQVTTVTSTPLAAALEGQGAEVVLRGLSRAVGPRHQHSHGWSCVRQPASSALDPVWDVTIVPSATAGLSPYKGCRFMASVALSSPPVWTFRSAIYHPMLRENGQLCSCLRKHALAHNAEDEVSGMVTVLRKLLTKPSALPPCQACRPDIMALTESLTDPQFFARKARIRTPGADPLEDADIMRGSKASQSQAAIFTDMLRTGSHSDIRIVVGRDGSQQATFKCHRTILAAKSMMFRQLFNSTADKGELRLNRTRPQTFARLLQYIYSGDIPGKLKISIPDIIELGSLAHACKVEQLRIFCFAMAKRFMTVETVADLLLVSQQHKEPAVTDALLKFLGKHVHAVARTEGWCRLLRHSPLKASATLRALQQVVAIQRSSSSVDGASRARTNCKLVSPTHPIVVAPSI